MITNSVEEQCWGNHDHLYATMPPKKASSGNKESKKTVEKKKDKVIEDKTFGLKNKKGAKTQKFIQQVQKQVKGNLPKVSIIPT